MEPYTLLAGLEAWYAKDYSAAAAGGAPPEYVHQLTQDQVAELDAAVAALQVSGLVDASDGHSVRLVSCQQLPLRELCHQADSVT